MKTSTQKGDDERTNQREAVGNIDNAKGRPVSGLVECERLSTGNPRAGKLSQRQRVIESTCQASSAP